MDTSPLSSTDAARNFSSVLDRVHHHGARYDIRRGKEIVARIVPADSSPCGITVAELESVLAALPRLARGDAERFEKDLAAGGKQLRRPRSPWA